DRLEERQTLDIANRAANLDQDKIDAFISAQNKLFDRIGDMRDDLDRCAEVIAPAFSGDDLLIDPSRRNIVLAHRRPPREALVMTEIEIGLCAVLGYKNFAVLIGTHRPGIDIEIRIELAQPDTVAARLQQRPERRRREPLAKRRHHAAGNEDKPRHGPWRLS